MGFGSLRIDVESVVIFDVCLSSSLGRISLEFELVLSLF